MTEERPATSGFEAKGAGASYASQWNRFAAWCDASGRRSLPASPEDVAAYLNDRRESGAKPSTLKVVAAAIARSHREAGFDVSAQQGVTRTVLDELTPDNSPSTTRALPLDLDCYLAIRKTAAPLEVACPSSTPPWATGLPRPKPSCLRVLSRP